MSKNLISDTVAEEISKNQEYQRDKFNRLWNLLDEAGLTDEQKNDVSELVNKIAYYSERKGLQRGVEVVNERLSSLYWACRPSDEYHYYQRPKNKVGA